MYSFTKHVLILCFKTFGPHYVASTSVHTHTHIHICTVCLMGTLIDMMHSPAPDLNYQN